MMRYHFIGFWICAALAFCLPQSQALADCSSCLAVVQATEEKEWTDPYPKGTTPVIKDFVTSELTGQKTFLISIFWEDNILPALMMMADQLTAVAMQQVQIIGSFLDAEHQMETQKSLEIIRARAHKDYHPSMGMCEFGSAAKSLAASERRGELTKIALSRRQIDRNMGRANTIGLEGSATDLASRLAQFKTKFCNPADNNNGLTSLCVPSPSGEERLPNADIDFARTIDLPWTLDVDLTDGEITDDEQAVFALAANLFSHQVFERTPPDRLNPVTGNNLTPPQKNFMAMRSIIAKRSVAENSFNAIASMKAAGTAGANDYLRDIVEDLGVPAAQIDALIGQNPSYYAQMEILTKKLYQNPDFYTNLYDTPANVDRKAVALQAIGLMQKFDLFKSYLRQEASTSVLLELAVMELQSDVEDRIGRARAVGRAGSGAGTQLPFAP